MIQFCILFLLSFCRKGTKFLLILLFLSVSTSGLNLRSSQESRLPPLTHRHTSIRDQRLLLRLLFIQRRRISDSQLNQDFTQILNHWINQLKHILNNVCEPGRWDFLHSPPLTLTLPPLTADQSLHRGADLLQHVGSTLNEIRGRAGESGQSLRREDAEESGKTRIC